MELNGKPPAAKPPGGGGKPPAVKAPVQWFFNILFVVLLCVPAAYREIDFRRSVGAAAEGAKTALASYGFYMQESSKTAGFHFQHTSPHLDSKLDHIQALVSSMGAAVSIVDFDHDGFPDVYVTNSGEGSKNSLYRNLGKGTFEDVAAQVGLADLNQVGTGVSMGAVWGDYDNDGYDDLFLYKWGKPELYHNDGGKTFTRVTDQAGLPPWVNANTAVWLDYDNDGKLDLFVGGYYDERIDLWHLKDTRMMPESFEYAANGGRKYLFHNLGGGRFEEVAEKMGINSRRWTLAAVAADFRGTGYPDLFIANDYGVSELYFNDHGKGFREVGKATGVGYAPKSGMNASIGDVLNEGRFGIYVSNITEDAILTQGNNFWVPKAGTSGDKIQYENMANSMGIENGAWSFGAQFGDFNNDGLLDLYVVNGNVSLDQKKSYWYDFSKVATGHKSIISDAANWPPVSGRSLAGYQQKRLWVNDGAGAFREVAQLVGVRDVYDGRSIALADFENRGVLDVVTANQNGPLLLYKNTVSPENKWIEFELEGRQTNRSAIGAQVTVYWKGKKQVQEVSGGSGFCAQNQKRLHFGLGKIDGVEKVEIRWSSGKVQTLTAPTLDRIHKIEEPV
jgi:enediyne biosynthesis protein E4